MKTRHLVVKSVMGLDSAGARSLSFLFACRGLMIARIEADSAL
jgi:hypothetical protein